MTRPTFANAPLSVLPGEAVALRMRLEDLDRQHMRARSPERRRQIEAKMREAKLEFDKLKKAEEAVDAAAKKWWEEVERLFKQHLEPKDEGD